MHGFEQVLLEGSLTGLEVLQHTLHVLNLVVKDVDLGLLGLDLGVHGLGLLASTFIDD